MYTRESEKKEMNKEFLAELEKVLLENGWTEKKVIGWEKNGNSIVPFGSLKVRFFKGTRAMFDMNLVEIAVDGNKVTNRKGLSINL